MNKAQLQAKLDATADELARAKAVIAKLKKVNGEQLDRLIEATLAETWKTELESTIDDLIEEREKETQRADGYKKELEKRAAQRGING